jgi:hypothetical protein
MSTQDRAPAFPFYAKDWLADPKVASMSFDHKGRYITLIASMWEFSDAGCVIPLIMAERIVGKKFCATAVSLEMLSTFERDNMVFLFSDRLSSEAQKLKSRSESARRSAEARWRKQES